MTIIIPQHSKEAASAFYNQNCTIIATHKFQVALLLGLEAGNNTMRKYRDSLAITEELRATPTR